MRSGSQEYVATCLHNFIYLHTDACLGSGPFLNYEVSDIAKLQKNTPIDIIDLTGLCCRVQFYYVPQLMSWLELWNALPNQERSNQNVH